MNGHYSKLKLWMDDVLVTGELVSQNLQLLQKKKKKHLATSLLKYIYCCVSAFSFLLKNLLHLIFLEPLG